MKLIELCDDVEIDVSVEKIEKIFDFHCFRIKVPLTRFVKSTTGTNSYLQWVSVDDRLVLSNNGACHITKNRKLSPTKNRICHLGLKYTGS